MKANTVIVMVTALIVVACSQLLTGVNAAPELRKYEGGGEITGALKNDLYVKVNSWFVETFNSAESVIEYQDKDAGRVMGKYVFQLIDGGFSFRFKQTITVDVKAGRYRLIISDPYFRISGDILNGSNSSSSQFIPVEKASAIGKIREEWVKLDKSLAAYLETNSDW